MTEFQRLCHQLTTRALPLISLPIELNRIRQAAVTLVLREAEDQAELLLIKRAERPGDHWSGHLALPGGRAEQTDGDLIVTAARETWEEVGIVLDPKAHFLGRLETLVPQNPRLPKMEIAPLIAVVPSAVELKINVEVAAAFWLPVRELQASGLSVVHRYTYDEIVLKYPAYPSPFGPIWGITERILTSFLALLD